MYVSYIDAAQTLSQTYTYMGPYFIQFGESLNDARTKKTLTSTKQKPTMRLSLASAKTAFALMQKHLSIKKQRQQV
jgi:hypothetical protein